MVTKELQGLKALIVDDYVDGCNLVKVILRKKGIESICATSTQAALEIYRSLKPDILIIELDMPLENGFSLIRRIRALSPEEGGQIPAIAVTIRSLPEITLEAREAGFQELIAKPLNIDKLLAVVTGLLESTASRSANWF